MADSAKPKVVAPAEEVIRLDAYDEVPVLQRASRQKAEKEGALERPKGKGKGKGKKGKEEPQFKRDSGLSQRIRKYARPGAPFREVKAKGDKKLATEVKQRARQDRDAAFQLAKAEVLQTAEAGGVEVDEQDDTRRLAQKDILDSVGVGVARKAFSFELPAGPYNCSLTRNGAHLLAGGRKGHVAFMHLDSMKILCELHLKETVRAVQTLHNENMFAVCQKKYIYIYDSQGMELHCIKHQKFPTHLDFLPYHFLLVSAGEKEIAWRDITHGQQVAEHKMHLGPATCLRQNPKNGIMHVGHNRGVVSMWAPNVKEPVVKMGCQNAQVMALAVSDNYMVTAGAESKWKVWDLRTYKALHSFRTHGYTVTSLDVSMTGMVALAKGCRFEAWKDVFTATPHQTPFITELYKGRMLECTRFRPFEDVCCVGHSDGLSSLIVPGAGKANFDSFEANPFQTKNQRREREVQSLLDKLQPDSIMLDPNEIGQLNREVVKAWQETKKKEEEEQAAESTKNKKKMRGKNKVGNRMKRKALKEGAEQRQKAKSRVSGGGEGEGDDSEEEEEVEAEGRAARQEEAAPPGVGAALSRFYGKKRKKT